MVYLQTDLLSRYLENLKNALIVFGSSSCKKCKILKEHLTLNSQLYETENIIYVEGNKFPNSLKQFQIYFFPTVIKIENEMESFRLIGDQIQEYIKY
jgi:thiol-disulfide isomerase/thioredoxin